MVIDNDYLNTMDCSVNQTLTHPLIMVTNPPVYFILPSFIIEFTIFNKSTKIGIPEIDSICSYSCI